MTVTNELRKFQFYGNGVNKTWACPGLLFYDNAHIVVKVKVNGALDFVTVSPAEYTVTGKDTGDCSVVYPVFGAPLTSLDQVQIERLVPYTQTGLQLNASSGFSPEALMKEVNLAVMRDQQNRDGDTGTVFGLPVELAERVFAQQFEDMATAVVLLPGATAFGYGTTVIWRSADAGVTYAVPENNIAISTQPDIVGAMARMLRTYPNLDRVLLPIAYFGSDLRVGECTIKAKTENSARLTAPRAWAAGGFTMATADEVPQVNGRPVYGSSPDDTSIVECIQYLKSLGLKVVIYPFILMDQLPGNGLPDPYGGTEQAALPWRGRITVMPGDAGTAAARTQVNTFFERTNGYEEFVEHLCDLCEDAGGVYGFCVGTELVGITRIKDNTGAYPGVDKLTTLVGTVKARSIATFVGYAADWTEYKNHVESNNVTYNMDKLWSVCDFIGIDNYMPLGDWRDGPFHKDYVAGWKSESDEAYVFSQIEGGELGEYFYADAAARRAQTRTAITDGAYGTPEEFQQKALRWFWTNFHYNRVGGVRSVTPTDWIPRSKPIWITEFGVPSVNRGGNQPNVFVTGNGSSESALPYYSNGTPDFFHQRSVLTAYLRYWRLFNSFGGAAPMTWQVNGGEPLRWLTGSEVLNWWTLDQFANANPLLSTPDIYIWAEDVRAAEDERGNVVFPARQDVWIDGQDWRLGHWISGKFGTPLRTGVEFAPKEDFLLQRERFKTGDVYLAGASVTTGVVVPARSLILGAYLEVVETVTGATSINFGDAGDGDGVGADADRYGAGIAVTLGSRSFNPVSPLAVYGDTALTLTGVGGSFTGGRVRLYVWYIAPPVSL